VPSFVRVPGFATTVGTELDAANVRRYFRGICKAAGIGENGTTRRPNPTELLKSNGRTETGSGANVACRAVGRYGSLSKITCGSRVSP
jgi:hypothetical protein